MYLITLFKIYDMQEHVDSKDSSSFCVKRVIFIFFWGGGGGGGGGVINDPLFCQAAKELKS